MRTPFLVGAMAFLAGSISSVRGDVIAYTSLGANDAYAYPSFTGSGIIGGNGATRTEAAFKFTPTVGGDITKVRLALGTNFAVNLGIVTLYADDANYPNPSKLTLNLAGVPLFDIANPGNNALALTVLNVNGRNRNITAGTPYWLSVAPGLPDPNNGTPNAIVWFDNSRGLVNSFAQRTDPPRPNNDFVVFNNTTLGAFEVSVADVVAPEPTSSIYLPGALITFAVVCRRKRKLPRPSLHASALWSDSAARPECRRTSRIITSGTSHFVVPPPWMWRAAPRSAVPTAASGKFSCSKSG